MSDVQRPKRRENETVNRSSNRQFGLVMAGFLAILSALFTWRANWPLAAAAIGCAAAFAGMALVAPASLRPLNNIWFRLGLLLHKIVTPVIMMLMFFVVITPIALLMRGLGKRPISMRGDENVTSYWVPRAPPGPGPMSKQY